MFLKIFKIFLLHNLKVLQNNTFEKKNHFSEMKLISNNTNN